MERLAYLMVGDPESARDLAQEAFARAFASWRRVGGYDRPGAWVRRVLIRLAVRARGRRSREVPGETPDRPVVAGETTAIVVRDAVLALPPRQRACVVMTYFVGLSAREVGEALGCAEATVRVHLHDARRTLAEQLGEFAMEEVSTDEC